MLTRINLEFLVLVNSSLEFLCFFIRPRGTISVGDAGNAVLAVVPADLLALAMRAFLRVRICHLLFYFKNLFAFSVFANVVVPWHSLSLKIINRQAVWAFLTSDKLIFFQLKTIPAYDCLAAFATSG